MHLRRLVSGAAAFTLVWAGQALSFAPVPSSEQLEFPLQYLRAAGSYRTGQIEDQTEGRTLSIGAGWTIKTHPLTGAVHMAWGGDFDASAGQITNEAAAAEAARGVIDIASDLLATSGSNVELRNVSTAPDKWSVHFQQMVNGLKVHTGEAFVLMNNAGRVAAFGSDFFPVGHDVAATPRLSSSQALEIAAAALHATPRPASPATMDLLYVPAIGDEVYELRLAYRVVFETDQPYGKWESFVDGMTGEILARRNFVHTVNVTGTSQGDVEDFGYCDGVATKPFENQTVNVSGGNNDVTDDAGAFVITHGGVAPVTVTSQFLGPFINVNRYSGLGADASFSGPATPGTPLTINWTNANSRADERDSFFHGNRSHDFMKAIDPTFNGLDYAMPTSVGRTDGFCPGNAWWDGNGMNYCEGTTQYGNTGRIGNVVYHEYGHGVTQEVYQANGSGDPSGVGMHEGNSDVLANLIDRQPIIGLGFFLNNCTGGIRNSDNNLQWPAVQFEEDHFAGQVIAGFVWDTWQSMLADLPQVDADLAIRNMWHLSRDLGVPQDQQSQVDWSFLADDDDADLGNGTPHHEHLALGAENHGFDFLPFGVLITHEPLGSTDDGSAGFDIDATVQSTVSTIDPTSVFLHYRVNGGSFTDLQMTVGNPNEYSAHIPAISGGNSEVQYYISAADLAANVATSPANAPTELHGFDVAHVADNLESGIGSWTIGAAGDNATTGIWGLMNPIGTAAQPEDDATPAPGVFAFITGQCSGAGCSPCALGCNDVDGGVTTLTSPIYNLTGATSAKLKYQRWYSNSTGGAPNSDFWVVDVSNNGGATWTNVENTLVTDHSWKTASIDLDALFGTPGQVRVRFRASDNGEGSLVEAGVDELRILADFGATDVEDVIASSTPLYFTLAQNQPNPFSPMTRIEFAIPQKSEVSLAVFDVSGRMVRTLTQGSRDAGRYALNWDGKDATGERVSAGVYFYRLSAGAETLTRKMTVLK